MKFAQVQSANQIRDAFAKFKPDIEAQFKRQIEYQLANMFQDLGPTLKNVRNNWKWAKRYQNLRTYVMADPSDLQVSTNSRIRINDQVKVIDHANMDKKAKEYSEFAVEECVGKIVKKMGELDSAECDVFNGFQNFVVKGTKNGMAVVITQSMIVNTSKLGTLFNQFPALISVDGKRVSEAAFKKLF